MIVTVAMGDKQGNKTLWTPGPWWFADHWYQGTGELLVFDRTPKNGKIFAVGESPYLIHSNYMGRLERAQESGLSTRNRTTLANARLIASAPDLATVAEMVLTYFGDDEIDPVLSGDIALRDAARKALAKARGDQ